MASLLSNEKFSIYYQRVNLLYRRPEIRASLETILSVFTVTVLIFAAIRPTLINIASLQKKITDQEVVNKKADNKIVQLFNAQNQLNTFASDLRLFDAAVPDVFSYVDSAKRIEYVAKINNLTIDTLSFAGYTLLGDGSVKSDWIAKIIKPTTNNTQLDPVTFSVNGKPQDVINFIREVENMDRLVALDSVSLSKQIGLNKAEDTIRANGQMTFYFYFETP